MNINQQQLQLAITQNNIIPGKGPQAIPILLDYTGSVTQYVLDLELIQSRGYFELCQTLFLDLSQSPNDLTVVIGGTAQNIVARAGKQGYYRVLCSNPIRMNFNSSGAGGVVIPAILINVAVPPVVW